MANRFQRYLSDRRGITYEGHDIEVEISRKRVVFIRATLRIDQKVHESKELVYGTYRLDAQLEDGTAVEVAVATGVIGETTRAQIRRADGSWTDLEERAATSS